MPLPADTPLGQRLGQLAGAIRARFQARAGERGADMRLTGILLTIAADPGLTQRDAARRMALDPSTFGRLLDQLDRDGLIRRLTHASDRRAHALDLTPNGNARAERARAQLAAQEAEILARLTEDERRALDLGLAALTRALRGAGGG